MTKLPECIPFLVRSGIDVEDALALRRVAMQLHRWHELECGVDNGGVGLDQVWRWRGNRATPTRSRQLLIEAMFGEAEIKRQGQ